MKKLMIFISLAFGIGLNAGAQIIVNNNGVTKKGSDNGFFLRGVFDSNAPYSPDSTDTDNTRGTEGYFQYHVKAVVGIRK